MDKEHSHYSVLVLLNGGIDSSALVHYHISQGQKVEAVFFDYGQINSNQEFLSALKVSKYYGIKLHHKELGFKLDGYDGAIYGRNSFFILAGCSLLRKNSSLISIGIHSGEPFYDSSPAFMKDIQKILDGYFKGTAKVIAPFLNYSKDQIYDYAIRNQVPVQLTYNFPLK